MRWPTCCTARFGGPGPLGHRGRGRLFYFLLHAIGMATGFAFGTLFLNTAAAIVIYFVYSFVLPACSSSAHS